MEFNKETLFNNKITDAVEFPELQELRKQALRRHYKELSGIDKNEKHNRWNILKIVVWKNLTIRRRRKGQFVLLLLQLFLWFGIACFSIASRKTRMEYLEEPYDGPSSLVPRIHPSDTKLPIAISYDETIFKNEDEANFTNTKKGVTEVLSHFSQYYNLTYGEVPAFRLFDSHEHLQATMRQDKRFPYGLHFDKLDFDSNSYEMKFVFWEGEVPISNEFYAHHCRSLASQPTVFNEYKPICPMKQYGTHGFLFAQTAINSAINNIKRELANLPRIVERPSSRFRLEMGNVGIVAERFPDHHLVRSQAAEMAPTAPFYFIFALVSVFSFVVMDMVAEKESKMKEVMKTYGLSSGMFWLSWFVTYCLLNVIIIWCALFVCTVGGVFGPVTSILVVALLLYSYLLSLITMGFIISVFFNKQQTATLAGMSFNLILYGLSWVLHQTSSSSWFIKGILMLFSTVTFSLSVIDLLTMLPDNGVTAMKLFNFKEHSVGIYILVILFDAILYFVLAWYLDQTVRRDWGSAKSWDFVFDFLLQKIKKKLWKKSEFQLLNDEETPEEDVAQDGLPEWVEPVSNEVRKKGANVKIRNLLKQFSGPEGMKTVVDLESLDIYPGEIMGLLGHNGAGKTTIISMLTGMLRMDGGEAKIMGHCVSKEQEKTRQLISVCPQQNLFFDDLTCIEHLIFFSALRGIDVSTGLKQADNPDFCSDYLIQKRFLLEQRAVLVDAIVNNSGNILEIQRKGIIEMEKHFNRFGLSLFTDSKVNFLHAQGRTITMVDTWAGVLAAIEKVGLSDKLFSFPCQLSGGMKRRLWLAIALIGDPKVLFLDEPTSGVDPLGRQELWTQIQDEKHAGRSIVISTHHMEEADILADRKAVITAGRLRCVGSSLFLKSKFGIGYYLECQAAPNLKFNDVAEVTLEFLQKFVPEARRNFDDGTATAIAAARRRLILFSLPLSSVDKFSELFEELNKNVTSLGLSNYGISLSTLEEVFFKLGDEESLMQSNLEEGLDVRSRFNNNPLSNHGSVFNAEPGAKTLERSPLASSRQPLQHGIRGDLVSQKFENYSYSATPPFKLFAAIFKLRCIQILHNRIAFTIDVIFPIIMLLASLFFREGGPGDLAVFESRRNVTLPLLTPHDLPSDGKIVFSVDTRLCLQGLSDVYSILDSFPADIKERLYLVDVLEPTIEGDEVINLNELVWNSMSNEKKSQYVFSEKQELGLPQTAWKADKVYLDVSLLSAPMHGGAVRNFIYTAKNLRPNLKIIAGISFEPWSLTQHFKSSQFEVVNDRLQARLFYDAGISQELPILLSLILDSFLKNQNTSATAITTTSTTSTTTTMKNHLHIVSTPILVEIPVYVSSLTYGMYVMLSLGLTSLPSRFGIQIMLDKFTGTKHAMVVMGLSFYTYWLGSFVTNYLAMLFGNSIVCLFLAKFIPIFNSFVIVPVLLCAVFFSASVLLWAYFLSQMFYELKAFSMTLQLLGMVFTLCPAYVVSIFSDAAGGSRNWQIATMAVHIFSSFFLPPYNPIGCLIGCATIATRGFTQQRTPPLHEYFWFSNLPIWSLIGSVFQCLVLYVATVSVDYNLYNRKGVILGAPQLLAQFHERREHRRREWLQRKGGDESAIPVSLQNNKDEDVLNEEVECTKIRAILKGQERLLNAAETQEKKEELSKQFHQASIEDPEFPDELPLVLLDDIHYIFPPAASGQLPNVAVRGVSLALYRGEIFGLLGPNGAGKTTSINLLTCNYTVTSPCRGAALMGGHDVSRDPSKAFCHLGLCPQFDALWPDVSVKENLKTFARIKNTPEDKLDEVVGKYIAELDLEKHQWKRISECSGGNKRRVSVAVAFIGSPSVVLMDEPSSGIDPIGRKKISDLIQRNASERTVLITTHSMEEAEALCSRIGIIVNGELNCLNTSLAIRNRYGSGIRLEVCFDEESSNFVGFDPTGEVKNPWEIFLSNQICGDAREVDRIANRATYDIPLQATNLGRLFGLLESNKSRYAVKDYALSQPTLDQVFIAFAKRQKSAQDSMNEVF